jgi:electron transfer flavoprotein alpha subunit
MASASGEKITLVIAEMEDNAISNATYEVLRTGIELVEGIGGKLCTALPGHGIKSSAEKLAGFSHEVYVIDNLALERFQTEFYSHAIETLVQSLNPDIILMSHSLEALDLAPRLSCRLGIRLVTDCIRFEIDPGGNLLCDKPVYGDIAIATYLLENAPKMATLRQKVMDPAEVLPEKGKIIPFDAAIDLSLARTESVETIPGESVNLDKSDAIVAAGRGVKEVEGLKQIEELIETLKKYFRQVELGASRPLIDQGWLPSSRQVGLTGEKVSPQLYLAVGISGASQHLSGIAGAKTIVAINRDEDAIIFKSSDYGVVGEYESVVPALIKKLRELS